MLGEYSKQVGTNDLNYSFGVEPFTQNHPDKGMGPNYQPPKWIVDIEIIHWCPNLDPFP
jgi:hypothetical protein